MTRTTDASRNPLKAAIGACWLLALMIIFLALEPHAARAHAAPSREYQVKAACLLNFLQFIEWPAATFPQAESPIMIGVLGDDPFGQVLDQTFQDETVRGRRLMIKRSRQVDELKTCHMLFVAKSESHRMAEILASLNDASIVTVGENEPFAHQGGIINFYIEGGKIRFEVNAEAAQPKGIKIGSQLLKRARIVGRDPRKGRE